MTTITLKLRDYARQANYSVEITAGAAVYLIRNRKHRPGHTLARGTVKSVSPTGAQFSVSLGELPVARFHTGNDKDAANEIGVGKWDASWVIVTQEMYERVQGDEAADRAREQAAGIISKAMEQLEKRTSRLREYNMSIELRAECQQLIATIVNSLNSIPLKG